MSRRTLLLSSTRKVGSSNVRTPGDASASFNPGPESAGGIRVPLHALNHECDWELFFQHSPADVRVRGTGGKQPLAKETVPQIFYRVANHFDQFLQ